MTDEKSKRHLIYNKFAMYISLDWYKNLSIPYSVLKKLMKKKKTYTDVKVSYT